MINLTVGKKMRYWNEYLNFIGECYILHKLYSQTHPSFVLSQDKLMRCYLSLKCNM